MKKQIAAASAFLILLFAPYMILLLYFGAAGSINTDDFSWALKNTVSQALLSSFLTFGFGFLGALGLVGWSSQLSSKAYVWLEGFVLIPNVLPSLFVILSTFKLIEHFPFGILGISIVHTIINSGLVAVILARIFHSRLLGISELALIEGASFKQFVRVAVFGYLKTDILYLFLFLFSVAFSSFSVPLAVGGGSGTTLEVLIYESIVIKGNWSEAITLSLIQTLMVFLLALFPSQPTRSKSRLKGNLRVLSKPLFLMLPVALTLFSVMPIFLNLMDGFHQLQAVQFQFSQFFDLFTQSILIGILSGMFTLSLFAIVLSCYNQEWMQKILRGYLAPSTVLVGFSILLVPPPEWCPDAIRVAFGLCLIFTPSLFRLGFDQRLRNLKQQILNARILGAGPKLIIRDIIFPQMGDVLGMVSGMAAFWSVGDFALSGIISSGDNNLALLVHSLMSNYRINAALALSAPLLLSGIVCFAIFMGVGRVISRKSNS